jgi:hypothetical protein
MKRSHDLFRHLLVGRVEVCENNMHLSRERFPYMLSYANICIHYLANLLNYLFKSNNNFK